MSFFRWVYLSFLALIGAGDIESRDATVNISDPWLRKLLAWLRAYYWVPLILIALVLLSNVDFQKSAVPESPKVAAPTSINVVDECTLEDPDSGRLFVAMDCMDNYNPVAYCLEKTPSSYLVAVGIGVIAVLLYLRRRNENSEGEKS